ncbi:MAG: hypothetical protein RQ758_04015 [Methanomicrobiaceae archaeon]|nr:hypothetical protein [Methanomicrobiaceae archaeon]
MNPPLTPEQRLGILRAMGCRCEFCSIRFPAAFLRIHCIYGENAAPDEEGDLDKMILVVCPVCHGLLHALPTEIRTWSMQKRLIRNRPLGVKRKIREVLGYRSRPYTPPPVDLAEIFEEFQQRGGFQAF